MAVHRGELRAPIWLHQACSLHAKALTHVIISRGNCLPLLLASVGSHPLQGAASATDPMYYTFDVQGRQVRPIRRQLTLQHSFPIAFVHNPQQPLLHLQMSDHPSFKATLLSFAGL